MQSFQYVVKDELGLHARPAGLLVKEVKNYKSIITVEKEGRKVEASRLMAVMSLAVKKDNEITVYAEGEDEEVAIAGMKRFFEENL